jgi:GTP-binding protein HflX
MPVEKAIACGWFSGQQRDKEIASALNELEALCRSAGAVVAAQVWQKRPVPDRRFLVGLGKAEEIKSLLAIHNANLVVFFNLLTTLQQRNLEDLLSVKVIDRSRLILDIFAARARSLEGKLQVELAQLLYLLPRLTGKGVALSRLGGGIGTRGPGETKLETDRRQIKVKIGRIRQKLKSVTRNRDLQRQNRRSLPVPLVSLVGYTSAGKSTLFRSLTGEDVSISQELFTTLDPLLRRVDLYDTHPGYYFILSDTVGFIRDMPAELFTSFKATLEEVHQADLVLHVVDLTNPDWPGQKNEVEKVLRQLEVDPDRVILVFNKIDLRQDRENLFAEEGSGAIYISASRPLGLTALKEEIFRRYFSNYGSYTVEVADEQQLDALGRWAIVLEKNRSGDGFQARVLCSLGKMLQFKEMHGGAIR